MSNLTLREYLETLLQLCKEQPDVADLMVVTSADDEGNKYYEGFYDPTLGNYSNGEFVPIDDYEDYDLSEEDTNAVCIN